jgi:hypothetical protein
MGPRRPQLTPPPLPFQPVADRRGCAAQITAPQSISHAPESCTSRRHLSRSTGAYLVLVKRAPPSAFGKCALLRAETRIHPPREALPFAPVHGLGDLVLVETFWLTMPEISANNPTRCGLKVAELYVSGSPLPRLRAFMFSVFRVFYVH